MKYLILLLLAVPFYVHVQDGKLAENLQNHVSFLADRQQQGRGLGTEGIEYSRSYIKKHFKQAGLKPFAHSFVHPFQFRENLTLVTGFNIAGYLEGADARLRDEYIVIGAHYDHLGYEVKNTNDTVFYLGADDNASGTAGLIELAKHFGKEENRTKRSIIFVAFDAEESGLYGSTKFVENFPAPLNKIKVMFSLDMIGMLESYQGLDMKGLGFINNAEETFGDIASNEGIKLKTTKKVVERYTDTAPFGDVGIPAIHVFTGLESPYHQPEDTADKLDYEGMEKIVRFLTVGISQLANQPTIAFAKGISEKRIKEGGKKPIVKLGAVMYFGSGSHRYIDQFYRSERTFNSTIGLTSSIRLTRNFRIATDVLLDYNGGARPQGNLRRLSTTIPLSIEFGPSDITGEMIRPYVKLGGFYRFNNLAWQGVDEMNFENGFEQYEYGINTEVGLQINRFEIRYTFRRSLSDNRILNERFQDINHLFGISYSFW